MSDCDCADDWTCEEHRAPHFVQPLSRLSGNKDIYCAQHGWSRNPCPHCAVLSGLRTRLKAAEAVVEMCRNGNCCEGFDTTFTDEHDRRFADFDAAAGKGE